MGYGLTGTLRTNPFEPDQMIYDLEHYLRMHDFMKMGKKGLQPFACECSGSDTPQLPVGPAKIRLPRQRRMNAEEYCEIVIKPEHPRVILLRGRRPSRYTD